MLDTEEDIETGTLPFNERYFGRSMQGAGHWRSFRKYESLS